METRVIYLFYIFYEQFHFNARLLYLLQHLRKILILLTTHALDCSTSYKNCAISLYSINYPLAKKNTSFAAFLSVLHHSV